MIYLNNAATSHPKPEAVYVEVCRELRNASANPSRSAHRTATDAGRTIFEARERLAQLFGIRHSDRIVFTSNATGALNLATLGLLKPGDHCITTSMEHNALGRPLEFLGSLGVAVEKVPCTSRGVLHAKDISAAITNRTKLIAITHASNVIGTLTPLAEIAKIARRAGIPLLLDAAQTAGSYPLNVEALGLALLACPGHKGLLGPQGTGFLYVAPHLQLRPILFGGTGSQSAEMQMPDFLPDRHEAGTLNTPGIAGLGAGAQFLLDQGIAIVRAHEMALCGRLLEGLSGIEGMELYGLLDPLDRTSVVSFNLTSVDPAEIGNCLNEEFDIAVRVGLHCAPDAHRTMDTFPRGVVRLSPGFFNSLDDVDMALEAVASIAARHRKKTQAFAFTST
jgi:cysteine desulfurase family protein